MKKYLFLAVIALLVVYVMSNMTYSQQTIVPTLRGLLASEPFKEQLSLLEFTYWGKTISIETRGYYHFVEFLIRKSTHFLGFGLVGALFFLLYRKLKWWMPAILAVVTIFFIAMIDEYNQMFTPGRTGTFEDVRLDTAGALVMVLFVKVLLKLRGK